MSQPDVVSKKEQMKMLLASQKILPLPAIGIVAVIYSLLIFSTLSQHKNIFLPLGIGVSWLLMAFFSFKGKLLQLASVCEKLLLLQIANTAITVASANFINDDGFYFFVLISIINLAIIIGINSFVRGKISREDIALAKALRLIWF